MGCSDMVQRIRYQPNSPSNGRQGSIRYFLFLISIYSFSCRYAGLGNDVCRVLGWRLGELHDHVGPKWPHFRFQMLGTLGLHDNVMVWTCCPHYWPFLVISGVAVICDIITFMRRRCKQGRVLLHWLILRRRKHFNYWQGSFLLRT